MVGARPRVRARARVRARVSAPRACSVTTGLAMMPAASAQLGQG